MSSSPGTNGYKTLIAACSLVLGIVGLIGGLVISSQSDKDRDQNKRIEALENSAIGKDFATEKFRIVEKELDLGRTERKAIDDKVVPWAVHAEKWRANDAQNTAFQKQIDDIKKEMGSTYSLADKIKEMQSQINQLTQLQHSQKPQTDK